MSQALAERPGIGHNQPPPLTSEQLDELKSNLLDPGLISDQLASDYAHHLRRRDELLGGVTRMIIAYGNVKQVDALPDMGSRGAMVVLKGDGKPYAWTIPAASQGGDPAWQPADLWQFVSVHLPSLVIPDAEIATKATSFAKQLKDVAKAVEADRVKEKGPYDGAADAVQSFFKPGIHERLSGAAKGIERALGAFQARLAEEERRRRAEEARKAQEEADRATKAALRTGNEEILDTAIQATERAEKLQQRAAAPVADLGRVAGSLGGTSALLSRWTFEVVDETKIPREYWTLDTRKIAEQVRREKDKCQIPGIRPYPDTTASVR